MSRLSLAQQIAQLDEPAPLDVDPEALHSGEPTEAEGGAGIATGIDTDSAAAAREHYLDVGPSILRKKAQDSIADPKYDGVRVSRKTLEMDEDEDDESGLESDEEHAQEFPGHSEDDEESEDEGEEEEDEEEEESEEEPPRKTQPSSNSNNPPEPEPESQQNANDDDLSSTLAQKREEDKRKGRAVVKQLALWDSLLDARIRLQKFAVAANKLPIPSTIQPYVAQAQHPRIRCREAQERLAKETVMLGEEILEFRKDLIKRENIDVNLEDARPAKRRRVIGDGGQDEEMEMDVEVGDAGEVLKEASEDVVRMEHAYHKHLIQTLHKWSAKVAAVAPETLRSSNKNSFSGGGGRGGKGAGGVKGVGEQVDEILRADGEKVRKRTRVRRSKGDRVRLHLGEGEGEGEVEKGTDGDEDVDEEVFDDTDFYQQLLRDVIEAKGAGGGAGGGMSEDWMMMQKQRKARKNVDTKASKGRKLRYEVHEKIQNFMVPVPLHNGWHESQIDELFASLLGKGFEHANNGGHMVDDDVDDMGVERVELGAEALKGFRVFG